MVMHTPYFSSYSLVSCVFFVLLFLLLLFVCFHLGLRRYVMVMHTPADTQNFLNPIVTSTRSLCTIKKVYCYGMVMHTP